MSDFMKKQSIAFYLNAIALVLGIAGLVLTIVSSTITAAYSYNALGLMIVLGVAGIVLCVGAIYAPNKLGNHNLVSAICTLGAIGAYWAVIGNIILDRVLLVSGLFSYNAHNKIGWTVFYVSVAAIACLLVAILMLIVGSFLKSVKEVKPEVFE